MLPQPPSEDNGPVRCSDENEHAVRHALHQRLAPTDQLLPDAIIMLLLASAPTLPPHKLVRYLLPARFIIILAAPLYFFPEPASARETLSILLIHNAYTDA